MKPDAVVITGLMRSGTSLVAQIVHRLGFCVATTMTPPIPPTWRSDWEDFEVSARLVEHYWATVWWWKDNIETRRAVASRFGFEGRIALKSPYLALAWEELMQAFGPEKPVVIRTHRNPAAVARSMAAHPQLSQKNQKRIQMKLAEIQADLVVVYERLVADPSGGVVAIAEALAVVDDEAISAAIELVGKPTEYPCPQPSEP